MEKDNLPYSNDSYTYKPFGLWTDQEKCVWILLREITQMTTIMLLEDSFCKEN